MWLEGHLVFSSFFSRTCGFWSCFILEFMIMSREHEKKILNCGHPLLISSHISRTTQWTALDWDPQALSIMMSDDVPPSLQQFEHVQCTITLYHIISHCTWDDIRIIRPFGDVSVGIHSIPFPPEFLLHGDVFPWLVQWPTVASCGLYLPRPDSAPGISVHGAGLEVANGIYVRTGFKVGRIWKNCGALKLFVHLCAELPRKQGWPAINDYILEVYRIWTHMKTLIYTYMCIICIYIQYYIILYTYYTKYIQIQ